MGLRKTLAGAVVALGMTMGSSAFAATVVNLGFAIDHSGSLSLSQYQLQQNGLANALALVAAASDADVQYNVSVISFGGDVQTLVAPTLLDNSNLATVQNAITSFNRTNTGSTRTGDAINAMTALYAGSLTDLTLFNLSTDGAPNAGADWNAASANAFAAGVDGISFEAVGSFSQGNINTMLALAGPDGAVHITSAADLPDPTKKGFVFEVSDYEDYEAAISAKIQKIVDVTNPSPVPVPAAGLLLLGGLGMLGGLRLRRRAA